MFYKNYLKCKLMASCIRSVRYFFLHYERLVGQGLTFVYQSCLSSSFLLLVFYLFLLVLMTENLTALENESNLAFINSGLPIRYFSTGVGKRAVFSPFCSRIELLLIWIG